jgi:hypothetical protein
VRALRQQAQQGADGAAGGAASASLQHLAQQDERGDDRRRLEVERRRLSGLAPRRGQKAWEKRRDRARAEGSQHAHADEREHVRAAVAQGIPGAHEQRPAGPEHRGRGHQHL